MELPARYPREHYQRKAAHYGTALRFLFNAKTDQTTEDRWRDLIAMSRGIDLYLDDGDLDTLPKRTAVVDTFLGNAGEVGDQFPALAFDQLGEERSKRLQRFGRAILATNLNVKDAKTLPEYVRHRRREGELYAHLITSVATPDVAAQPGYQRFARALPVIGEVTNLANSLLDIHDDYARGEITLAPNRLTRLQLLRHMASSALRLQPRNADELS